MIRYTLTCDQDHQFDSWFQSSAAFDTLAASGHLACSICGSTEVARAMMTPAVASGGKDLKSPLSEAETEVAKLRDHLAANSNDVGASFADEARKMHDGDLPERAIHGTAKLHEAKQLIDDGIPVAPLPFIPKRQTH